MGLDWEIVAPHVSIFPINFLFPLPSPSRSTTTTVYFTINLNLTLFSSTRPHPIFSSPILTHSCYPHYPIFTFFPILTLLKSSCFRPTSIQSSISPSLSFLTFPPPHTITSLYHPSTYYLPSPPALSLRPHKYIYFFYIHKHIANY